MAHGEQGLAGKGWTELWSVGWGAGGCVEMLYILLAFWLHGETFVKKTLNSISLFVNVDLD